MDYGLTATLTISEVSSIGTCLNYDNDIYLTVYVLGQHKETRLLPAELPAFFNDQFSISKTFYFENSPESVIHRLYDEPVYIKLVEVSGLTGLSTVLASYTTNARDLLFPYPSSLPYCSSYGREYMMVRTIDFPDYVSPRLRFSVSSQITPPEPVYRPARERYYEPMYRRVRGRSLVRSCPSYERPTFSSLNRSVSPKRSPRRVKNRGELSVPPRNAVGLYTQVPNYKIDSLREALSRLELDLGRARRCLN